MCGFLGEVSSQLLSQASFNELLNLSVKRGPDQQGFWHGENCQLGFNRLSILDLSENGTQPIFSPSGRFAMVFNGEVYNYKEIQTKYHISDNVLRSTSDSEILVHLLEKVNITNFAKELNGMFAIAIWDTITKQLYLIRDFAGIKPLYYGLYSEGIVFASQFDQIFQHPAFEKKKLRPEIMKEYFGLGYMHAPNTVFENIFQVKAGHYLEWDFSTKSIVNNQLYFPWITSCEIEESSPKAVKKFSEHFETVVKSQLHADVSVATFLSSGIDSSLVTAYAKKSKSDLKAFTFGINDSELNEADLAAEYAKVLKLTHVIEKSKSEDLLRIIDEHFAVMSEPFGDYSSVPTYLITKRAKQFATVMLAGDGGDELFWGYPRFIKSVMQAHWFRYPWFLRKLGMPVLRKFVKDLSYGIDTFQSFSDWILYKQLHFTNLDDFCPNVNFSEALIKTYSFTKPHSKKNILIYLKKNEFDAHMQRVLRKVDLMSMANSMEVRVPFLDKKIINYSNCIVSSLGVEHHIPKLILKLSLYQLIDENLVNKKKQGFSVPIEIWLRNELKDDFIRTVMEESFFGKEYVSEKCLRQMVNDFYNDKKSVNPWGLWHLYSWQKWALNYKLNDI